MAKPLIGVVASNKGDKTIIVSVTTRKRIPSTESNILFRSVSWRTMRKMKRSRVIAYRS
jgi:ribosomal protein S17